MALRAGYYGIKKKFLSQLLGLPNEVDDLSETVQVKADADLLAPTQATLTADKVYVVGDQFIYEDKLYKVTQDIAKDAAITIGTNAELAGSVTEQLTIKSVPTGITGVDAYKCGNTVMLYLHFDVPSGSGYYVAGTLPEGLRPIINLASVGYDNNVNTQAASTVIELSVNANGDIQTWRFSDKPSFALRATISYLTA